MAKPETVEQIRQTAAAITADNIDVLVQNAAWGAIDFKVAIPDLERLHSLIAPLTVLPLHLLPQNVANNMIGPLNSINDVLNQFRGFAITVDSPTGRRDEICNNLRNQIDNAYPVITPHIPFLAHAHGDVQRNITDLVNSVSRANVLVTEARGDLASKRAELDTIVAAAREASVKAGVAHFTHDFADASEANDASAETWLTITASLALLTAVAAFFSLFIDLPHDATVPVVINRLSSKLVFLGLLLGATIWCGRLYKAAKHQGAINRHRANALKTFQAFTQAASTEPVREAILMETTRSIFTLTATGYLDGADASGDGGTKVVEVVKNLTQTAATAHKV